MKKTFLFGLIAAALGFTACSSEDDAILSQKPQKGMMTLNATVQQSVDTRATLVVDPSPWAFDFANGDELKVTNSELPSGTYYTFTKGDAADFTSTDATPTSSPATWYAYFPSNTVTLTGQSGLSTDVANKYALVGTATSTTGSEGLDITMSAQVAILKIVNAGGSIDINVKNSATTWVTGLEANNESFTVTTSTTKASLLSKTTAGTYYVAVPAGVQLAIKNGNTVIKSTTVSGLVAGNYYTLIMGGVAWTKDWSSTSFQNNATKIYIETGVDVSSYAEDTNHQMLNSEGTLWGFYDSTNKILKIQTPAQQIRGRNSTYSSTSSSAKSMFKNFWYVTEINGLDKIDMSAVTNMSYMFYGCEKLTSLDLSSFNTSNATDVRYMFGNCAKLTSLDLRSFNTSKVIYMSYMFYNCEKLTSLDLSSFNTSKVTDMSSVFLYCQALPSINLSNFDTSKVTTMMQMFSNCQALTSLDLSNFNTNRVTDMQNMFANCWKLENLDVSSFNTSNVTKMSVMFSRCEVLPTLDLSNFKTSKVTSMASFFNQCYKLKELKLSDNFTIPSTKNDMFKECGKDATSSGNGQGVIYGVTDAAIKSACKASTNWSDTFMKFDGE